MPETDLRKCDVGIAGLAGLGRSVARDISSHLYQVAAYDSQPRDRANVVAADPFVHAQTLAELAGLLRQPRTIFIFCETEAQIDTVIGELLPHLSQQDLLIDGSNSYFKDTTRRARALSQRSIDFMGLGLWGIGPERRGTMIMAGGRREAHVRTRPLLEALASNTNGEPAVGYHDSPAAAHFVRMVHAGIEYALMQLVFETFDLMQRTLQLSDQDLHDVCANWRIGVFNGHLREFSGNVFSPVFKRSEWRVLEEMLAAVRKDSIARWSRQSARELGAPTPIIDAALESRHDLARERQLLLISTPFRHPSGKFGTQTEGVLDQLHKALYAAMIITYAEGLALLAKGSRWHGFGLDIVEIVRLWKGGCTVRISLLDDIIATLQATPALDNLLCDEDLSEKVWANQESLRRAVWRANELGSVVPCLLSALDSLDCCRDAWLPVNLVQIPPRDHSTRTAKQTDDTPLTRLPLLDAQVNRLSGFPAEGRSSAP
ncbi:MAG TPA: NAD(P)-binding domain-containing protein [Verrucomicrobiae bacterium]|nr:NAD(P)-binding domain-containing protein [Verrucomicrobiae bacterium]